MKKCRLQQSVDDRSALIQSLERTLLTADEDTPVARIESLRERIKDLRRRNESPERFVGHGSHLRYKYLYGIPSGAWSI